MTIGVECLDGKFLAVGCAVGVGQGPAEGIVRRRIDAVKHGSALRRAGHGNGSAVRQLRRCGDRRCADVEGAYRARSVCHLQLIITGRKVSTRNVLRLQAGRRHDHASGACQLPLGTGQGLADVEQPGSGLRDREACRLGLPCPGHDAAEAGRGVVRQLPRVEGLVVPLRYSQVALQRPAIIVSSANPQIVVAGLRQDRIRQRAVVKTPAVHDPASGVRHLPEGAAAGGNRGRQSQIAGGGGIDVVDGGVAIGARIERHGLSALQRGDRSFGSGQQFEVERTGRAPGIGDLQRVGARRNGHHTGIDRIGILRRSRSQAPAGRIGQVPIRVGAALRQLIELDPARTRYIDRVIADRTWRVICRGILPQRQRRRRRRALEQGEGIRIGRKVDALTVRLRFDAKVIRAADRCSKGVAISRTAARDELRIGTVDSPIPFRIGVNALQEQLVALVRGERIQRGLRRGCQYPRNRLVGADGHGGAVAEDAEVVVARRALIAVDGKRIGAGTKIDVRAIPRRQSLAGETRRPGERPLHLAALYPVEKELRRIGQRELIGVLRTGLKQAAFDVGHAGHGVVGIALHLL